MNRRVICPYCSGMGGDPEDRCEFCGGTGWTSPIPHTPTICVRDAGSYDMAGSAKGHSFAFECPECSRRGRFNTNFLGSRRVVCNGRRFLKVADEFGAIRDAGVSVRAWLDSGADR